MFPPRGPCADLVLWISENCVANLSTVQKRAESNLLAGEKGPQEIGQVALAEAKDLINWLV